MRAAACKASEDRRKGTGTPGGSHHVRMVDYTDAKPSPSGTDGLIGDCVWAGGSSVEAVWMTRSRHKSSPPGG